MKLKLVTFLAVLIFASVGMVDLVHAQNDEIGKSNILSISMLVSKKCPPVATASKLISKTR